MEQARRRPAQRRPFGPRAEWSDARRDRRPDGCGRSVGCAADVLGHGTPELIAAVETGLVSVRDAEAAGKAQGRLRAGHTLINALNAEQLPSNHPSERVQAPTYQDPARRESWNPYDADLGWLDDLEAGYIQDSGRDAADYNHLDFGMLHDVDAGGPSLPPDVTFEEDQPYWTALPWPETAHPISEIAALLPQLPEAAMRDICVSMRRYGYLRHQPILLYHGEILDGRARQKVAVRLGIKPDCLDVSEWPPEVALEHMLGQIDEGHSSDQVAMTIARLAM